MKTLKTLAFLSLTLVVLISTITLGQTELLNDMFDTYNVGQQLAYQNPTDWTTWSGVPGHATEDPLISNTYAYSDSNSVVIKPNNDLVRLHGQLTSGIAKVGFQMYIPTGKSGYFNSLNKFVIGAPNANQKWAFECYFNTGGNGSLRAAGSTIPFTYTNNAWHTVQLVVDLDIDLAQLWFDGNLIQQWQWTKGYNGAVGYPLQLDATDLFGAATTDEMYVDNFLVTYDRTITSKLSGGDWNSPSTWTGDIVPLPSDSVNIISGSVVTINSNITRNARTVVSGTLNCGTNVISGSDNFILLSGATLGIGSASGITTSGSSGNIQVSGTRSFSSAANYIYNGTAAQTTGNGLPLTLTANLTINNSAGVTLNAARTINGSLTLTSGNLTTTSTNLLTLGNSASVSGGSATSFISGPMAQTWATTTASKIYPLGKGPTYRPLVINLTTPVSPKIRAEVFNANAGGNKGILNAISTVRYYQISLISGSYSTGTLQMTYGADDGVTDNTTLVVAQSATQSGTYTSLGRSESTTSTVTSASNNPAFGNNCFLLLGSTETNPLPVELSSFSAVILEYGIRLKWRTETEVSNYGFEILRQAQDNKWDVLGFIEGHGNSNSPKNYSFIDENVTTGRYSYRLKQIDTDGKFEYSKVIEVDLGSTINYELSQNYPNPFNPSTTIRFSVSESSFINLSIFNSLGEKIAELVNEDKEPGVHTIEFIAQNLPSGTYFYTIKSNDFANTKKMILMK